MELQSAYQMRNRLKDRRRRPEHYVSQLAVNVPPSRERMLEQGLIPEDVALLSVVLPPTKEHPGGEVTDRIGDYRIDVADDTARMPPIRGQEDTFRLRPDGTVETRRIHVAGHLACHIDIEGRAHTNRQWPLTRQRWAAELAAQRTADWQASVSKGRRSEQHTQGEQK